MNLNWLRIKVRKLNIIRRVKHSSRISKHRKISKSEFEKKKTNEKNFIKARHSVSKSTLRELTPKKVQSAIILVPKLSVTKYKKTFMAESTNHHSSP